MTAATASLSLLIGNKDGSFRRTTAARIHCQSVGGASFRKILNFAFEDCVSHPTLERVKIECLHDRCLALVHDSFRIAVLPLKRN